MSHTPGPWQWSDEYLTSNQDKTWSLLGADGYGILSCDGLGNSPQEIGSNGRANARLISAAPDLLEALVDLIGWVPGANSWHTDGPVNAVERARAAIRKARGES